MRILNSCQWRTQKIPEGGSRGVRGMPGKILQNYTKKYANYT